LSFFHKYYFFFRKFTLVLIEQILWFFYLFYRIHNLLHVQTYMYVRNASNDQSFLGWYDMSYFFVTTAYLMAACCLGNKTSKTATFFHPFYPPVRWTRCGRCRVSRARRVGRMTWAASSGGSPGSPGSSASTTCKRSTYSRVRWRWLMVTGTHVLKLVQWDKSCHTTIYSTTAVMQSKDIHTQGRIKII